MVLFSEELEFRGVSFHTSRNDENIKYYIAHFEDSKCNHYEFFTKLEDCSNMVKGNIYNLKFNYSKGKVYFEGV